MTSTSASAVHKSLITLGAVRVGRASRACGAPGHFEPAVAAVGALPPPAPLGVSK
jgi:hypothetical protein